MSDAPERIWVAPWREGDWSEGDWDDNEGKTLNEKPCIQYVRAARIEALTAKLAKAVEMLILCRDMFDEVAHPSDPLSVLIKTTLAELEVKK